MALFLLLVLLAGSGLLWRWAQISGLMVAPTPTQTPTPAHTPTATADFRITAQFQDRLTQVAYQVAVQARATSTLVPDVRVTPQETAGALTPQPPPVQTEGAPPTPTTADDAGGAPLPTETPVPVEEPTGTPTATPTATDTATVTPSLTPTPTDTPTPTPTDTATATPSPTVTPFGQATPPFYVVASLNGYMRQSHFMRRGPEQRYPTVEPALTQGQQVEMRGRDRFGEWVYLCCPGNQAGWVRQAFVDARDNTLPAGAPATVTPDDVALLPIQVPEAIFTPTATPTPMLPGVYPQVSRDPGNRAFVPYLPRPPLNFPLRDQATTGSTTLGDVIAGSGNILIASQDSRLYSFDAEFGSQRWRVDVGGLARYGVLVQDDRVYVAIERDGFGQVLALRDQGFSVATLWTQTLSQPPAAPLALAADRLFVVTRGTNQNVHALNPLTGDELWRRTDVVGSEFSGTPLFKPAIGNQLFFYGSGDRIRALDVVSGALVWERSVPFVVTGAPLFSAPGSVRLAELFVADGDRGIFLLDANTGEPAWRVVLPSNVAAMALNDRILVARGSDRLWGLNRETGAMRWEISLTALESLGSPIVSPDLVAVVSRTGLVQLLDVESGGFQGAGQIPVNASGGAAAASGRIYVPTANQSIYAVGSAEQ